MVDRVNVPVEEGLTNSPADNTANTRPQWLPEKFSSPEDMAKSYSELEKEYTRLRQGDARGKPTATGKPDINEAFDNEVKPEDVDPNAQADQIQDDGLEQAKALLPGFTEDQIMEFSNTAWENGELSDDQYTALEKAGYGRELVDQYIEGQMALMDGYRAALVNAGGGEQSVQSMFNWAAQSLPQSEINRYNEKFDMGGPDALMAMEHLKSRWVDSGNAGNFAGGRVAGANAPQHEVSVYNSVAQVTKDMQSEQYKTDPAFRAAVAQKISRSKVL
jgi:hypothetical protein